MSSADVRYYASKVVAYSSQYSTAGPWSASAALGAPNNTRWCSRGPGGLQYLEFEFPALLNISKVTVDIDYGAGNLTEIKIFDESAQKYVSVYSKNAYSDNSASTFYETVNPPVYGKKVRIDMDERSPRSWTYVDSIMISGTKEPVEGPQKLFLSTTLDTSTGLTQGFNAADPDISDDGPSKPSSTKFKSVYVSSGRWILYSEKRFNDDKPDDGKIQIVHKGTQLLDFEPKSLRPIPAIPNSVMLFEHKNYGGTMLQTVIGSPLLKDFPIFNEAGVSSIIIEPFDRWRFWTEAQYGGNQFELGYGLYKDSSLFHDLNDRIQSVQKI